MPIRARGWCYNHWKRWRKYGDPTHRPPLHPRRPPADRFWPKVAIGAPEDCWEWTASRDDLGYGFFRMFPGVPMWKAHRASWAINHGPIPDGLAVLHACDNPPCVNPNPGHLFLGTLSDNTQDALAKGRWNRTPTHYGETSPKARLTAAQVDEIRCRYAAGESNQRELGEEFGICQTQVGRIVRRVHWKQ